MREHWEPKRLGEVRGDAMSRKEMINQIARYGSNFFHVPCLHAKALPNLALVE